MLQDCRQVLAHCLVSAHCLGAFQSAKDAGGDGRPLGCGRGMSKSPGQDAQASREPQAACATLRGHLSRADREKTKRMGIYHGLFFFTRRSHANSCPQSARGTCLRAEHTFYGRAYLLCCGSDHCMPGTAPGKRIFRGQPRDLRTDPKLIGQKELQTRSERKQAHAEQKPAHAMRLSLSSK
jgi:hypothetical protein